MAKGKEDITFVSTLLSAPLYKANQGQKVRQFTAAAVAAVVIIACMRLRGVILADSSPAIRNGVPFAILLVGLWLAYRLVNWPRFTNFLIDVEHEMEKVSWASWDYLYRATLVVLGTMLVLGAYLFLCDLFWQQFFLLIRFLDLEAYR